MNKISYIAILLFFVSSCSGLKENMGLVKYQPDEYQVETNNNLVIPDNFDIYSPEELMAKHSKENYNISGNLSHSEIGILKDMNTGGAQISKKISKEEISIIEKMDNNSSEAQMSKAEKDILHDMKKE